MRICIALLLVGVVVSGRAAERGPWSSVQADAIRGHVEFLASDLLEGRAAASRGYDIAAAYVAAQFRQSGLQPAAMTTRYFQSVPLLEATPVLPGSSAQLVRDDETHTFEYGTHYLPSADFTSASSTLTAPLVFAGFGVDAPELGYNDFENVDVKGRIAVVFSGAPAKFPHRSARLLLLDPEEVDDADRARRSRADHRRFSRRRGARAVGAQRRDELDAADALARRGRQAAERVSGIEAALPLQSRSRARACSRRRPLDSTQALAAAEAGEPQGFELPGMMTLSATTGLRRTESANVLARAARRRIRELKNEYIVLTAHLDHLGRGAAVNGDSIYNGAHDNAVGVGMLLEIARALRASDAKPRRSIVFAAVTAEEKGLLGSDYFARIARGRAAERIVANINIDMPHDRSRRCATSWRSAPSIHRSGALARDAAAAQGYRLSGDAAPEEVSLHPQRPVLVHPPGRPGHRAQGGYQARDTERSGGVAGECAQR